LPDRPDAAGLVDGDPNAWEPDRAGVDLPDAPAGTVAGGAGLESVPVAGVPVAGVPVGDVTGSPGSAGAGPGASGVLERSDAARLVGDDPDAWDPGLSSVDLPDAPAGAAAGGGGSDDGRPVGPAGFVVAGLSGEELEREEVARPDAAELLREDRPTWTGGEPVGEDRVPVVRPVEEDDTSGWDDGGAVWWLRGDEAEGEERVGDVRRD
jgi:integrin beta 3